MSDLSIRELLSQLVGEGYAIPEGNLEQAREFLRDESKASSPWYVRLFTGFSAWIAAIFLIMFLFLANVLNDDVGILAIGMFFIVIAVALNRSDLRNDFISQLGLALGLAGQVLAIYGLGSIFEDSFLVPLLIILGEIALIMVYKKPPSTLPFDVDNHWDDPFRTLRPRCG